MKSDTLKNALQCVCVFNAKKRGSVPTDLWLWFGVTQCGKKGAAADSEMRFGDQRAF